jgi:hypothetical protein
MKRFVKVESPLLAPSTFRGRLKSGLVRCQNEAQAYHACVTVRFLDTEEK